MVDLAVRVIEHSQTEYQMSHKLWFAPAPGVDAISATANTDGFTVLNAIARFYGWNYNDINRAPRRRTAEGRWLFCAEIVLICSSFQELSLAIRQVLARWLTTC